LKFDYNIYFGDWGLGIGDWQSPIPNPQSPKGTRHKNTKIKLLV